MCITKETKWHPSCRCHGNSYAAGPVLIKAKIPRFYLKPRSSTPKILMARVKTIWEPCAFRENPLYHFEMLQMKIFAFSQKETGTKSIAMATTVGVILFLLWCTFLVPSLKNTAPIFLEIFLIQYFCCSSVTIYDVIAFLICIIQKRKDL